MAPHVLDSALSWSKLSNERGRPMSMLSAKGRLGSASPAKPGSHGNSEQSDTFSHGSTGEAATQLGEEATVLTRSQLLLGELPAEVLRERALPFVCSLRCSLAMTGTSG